MPQDRLRDDDAPWGKSRVEYAQREKHRLRERMKKQRQKARIKMTPPPMLCEHPVEKYRLERLKGKDIQELGILAVTGKRKEFVQYIKGHREFVDTEVSLPYVSILHGTQP